MEDSSIVLMDMLTAYSRNNPDDLKELTSNYEKDIKYHIGYSAGRDGGTGNIRNCYGGSEAAISANLIWCYFLLATAVFTAIFCAVFGMMQNPAESRARLFRSV